MAIPSELLQARLHSLRLFPLVLAIAASGAMQAANAETSPSTVALCYFDSPSSSYREHVRAQQLAELVQAKLISGTDIDWVDRTDVDAALRELELSASVFGLDASKSLRVGRWLRSDMLIKGLVLRSADDTWRLQVEIIDLKRADVLESHSVRLERDAVGRAALTDANVDRAASAIRKSLTDSLRVRQQAADQVLVAPLYFANSHSTNRLDYFEDDLRKEFAKRNTKQNHIRYLQFPRSRDSLDEAYLIASGIVSSDAGPWEGVADYYVWGTYGEVDSSGVEFEDVEVDVTITIWDGRSRVSRVSDRARVRELPSLMDAVIAAIESRAKEKSPEPVDAGVRHKIAKDMAARAADLQEWVVQVDTGDFGRPSDEWLRLWRHCIRILSVAAFLDPTNEAIRRELLIETTRDDLPFYALPGNQEFRRLLNQSNAWKAYCDQFGYDYQHNRAPKLAHRAGLADNRLFHSSALVEFVHTAEEVMEAANRRSQSHLKANPPSDAPSEVVQQWQLVFTREYVDRLTFAIERSPNTMQRLAKQHLRTCLSTIRIDDLRAEAIQALWPLLLQDQTFDLGFREKLIRQTFAAIGKSDVAERLFAEMGGHPADSSRVGRREARPPRHLDAKRPQTVSPIAPLTEVPVKAISLDKYFYSQAVTALEYAEGRLWIGLEGQFRSLHQGCALFSCDVQGRDVRMVPLLGKSNSKLAGMCEDGKRLWMALDGGGVVQLDVATKEITSFTMRDGLPSHKMITIAKSGDIVYVGGGQEQRSALGSFNRLSNKWSEHSLPEDETRSLSRHTAQVTSLACDSEWLALYANYGGSCTSILVRKHTDEQWKDVGTQLRNAHPEFSHFERDWRPRISGLVWHDGLLWIATSRGLLAYDPLTQRFPSVHQIATELTAIVKVDDRILLGGIPFSGKRGAGTSSERACVLVFNPATRSWESQIAMPYKGKITAMAEYSTKLWCGVASKGATVVELDLNTVGPREPTFK